MSKLPEPPPHRRMWLLILTVVGVAAVAGAALAWQLPRPPVTPAAVPSAATELDWTQVARPRATPRPRTAAEPESGVLWQKTGSDIAAGRSFKAPRHWRIVWTFDCRNFAAYGGGNFKLSGEGAFSNVLIQRFAVKGQGTERVTGDGRGRLVIESVCQRWTVRAVAP